MTARNPLTTAPPYPVEQAMKTLGANLRTARLRRNLTIQEVAGKIGTGLRAVADAEKGKATTGIAIYAALLWVYGLLEDFTQLADPASDEAGLALMHEGARERAHRKDEIDNEF
ncbi:MAG: XRE family transcriptional regulator [Gammaproteobacteria bacterium]|nr:MAG: XRE family transcriptional regulator [Gammaproteobacteria bacterium]